MTIIRGQFEKTFPIAIVVSRFNQDITEGLAAGALQHLHAKGFNQHDITLVEVPGAVEIPIVVQRLARSRRYLAVVALGAVIQGDTRHFDYVCDQVSQGCQQVALAHDVPVIFGVLTTENKEQAQQRVGGSHGHKGVEAIDAAIEMVSVLKQLEQMQT